MTEKPIIFSAPMVRAILDGRKTQTRRVLKPPPRISSDGGVWYPRKDHPKAKHYGNVEHMRKGLPMDFSPYGQPGGLLWVRETWGSCTGCNPSPGDIYRADGTPNAHRWRPSIHMPRWASRITLRVTGVRVQRVQEISHADAIAEGCQALREWDLGREDVEPPREQFSILWNSIHAKRPERMWAANPWVAAVSFERVRA